MVVQQSRHRSHRFRCVLFAALVPLAASWLDGRELSGQENAVTASKELYNQAKSAETVEDLSVVLQRIEALNNTQISDQLHQYLVDLEAWVHHRRGEGYVKRAAQVTAAGDLDAGKDLDALALKDFDAAIHFGPKRWKSFHHRGVCYALAGRFDEALSDFSKTIELRPQYANAWFNRGEILYETGQFAKAVADYDEAIRLQPNDAGFYTSRGHANFQLRRFQPALDDYHQAVKMSPNDPEGFANRGDAFRSLGQWESAASDFRQAIELDRRFGRAYQSASWLMATCPDDRYRHAKLAVQAAAKAIQLDGDQDYIYLDTLAAAYANQGQFTKAQDTLRRAIRLAPRENVAPLKHRLDLYLAERPFRQTLGKVAQKTAPTIR